MERTYLGIRNRVVYVYKSAALCMQAFARFPIVSSYIPGCDAVKATYACEGKTMRLECDTYSVIQIYMAKYGRLEPGSSICPSVNIFTLTCRADRVLLKIATKCANRRICVIRANDATFGDPCPGTFKYLDVIYGCGEFLCII